MDHDDDAGESRVALFHDEGNEEPLRETERASVAALSERPPSGEGNAAAD
jgi:hypothetical protein